MLAKQQKSRAKNPEKLSQIQEGGCGGGGDGVTGGAVVGGGLGVGGGVEQISSSSTQSPR